MGSVSIDGLDMGYWAKVSVKSYAPEGDEVGHGPGGRILEVRCMNHTVKRYSHQQQQMSTCTAPLSVG